jgi:hypothetical protein
MEKGCGSTIWRTRLSNSLGLASDSAMRARNNKQFTRRDLLHGAALGMACLPVVRVLGWTEKQRTFVEPSRVPYSGSDDALLDEIERTAFEFF